MDSSMLAEGAAGRALDMTRRFTTRRDAVSCPACGHVVERKARQQRFCSPRCKENARQRTRKASLGQDTRAPTHPHKFVNENNTLQNRKWRPSLGISAPPAVISEELFAGREWERVTSEDGVTCLVSRKAAAP